VVRRIELREQPTREWQLPLRPRERIVAAVALGAGLILGFAAWPAEIPRAAWFAALMLGAVLTAALAPRRQDLEDVRTMLPSFVVDLAALLLLGPHAMTLVATTGAAARGAAARGTGAESAAWLSPRGLLHVATACVAALGAGLAYAAVSGAIGVVDWPWHALPVAAAVLAHGALTNGMVDLVVPVVTRRRLADARPIRAFRGAPARVVSAAVAVLIVEAIERGSWQILSVGALPLYLLFRTYAAWVGRLLDASQRRGVMGGFQQGLATLDDAGRVTFWNDALERLVAVPREEALGRPITDVVPALTPDGLQLAIDDVVSGRPVQALPDLELPGAAGVRLVRLHLLPGDAGVVLLWHDITEQSRAEETLNDRVARLDLASAGAKDGLWVWDTGTHELHVSARWRMLLGLPDESAPGRADEWLDRVHPDDVIPLKEALGAHLSGHAEHFQHEHRIRHADGTYRWYLCRGVAVRRGDGTGERIAGSLTDITEQAAAQDRIRRAGAQDPLTELSNRSVFAEMVGRALSHYRKHYAGRFAVLYLDLDRFKVVNDSLGHLVGDELLIAVARRLESCLRPGDALARLGGDEFAILLNGIGDDMQANVVAFRIQDALAASFSIGGREVFTSVSIGIAVGRAEHDSPEDIMRDADAAMYQAKARGKARHELFDADMHARALDRVSLENDLRHAVRHRGLEVHYQPIVALETGLCVGFEALVRWTRNGKAVSPMVFVPLAEELGLIEGLGGWVMEESCRRFGSWRRQFPGAALDCITVNVSARQLTQQGFVQFVEQTVDAAGIAPRDLRLEITETALMDTPRDVASVLQGLRQYGVKIYLDDFGTGYSSLSHLHKLPVDALKIDRSFVRSLLITDRPAIVESILALARTLETGVVAEGVESGVQAHELERLGCRHAQGYFFSPPVPGRAVEEILRANRPLGRRDGPPPGTPWTGNEPAAGLVMGEVA
jgi:diguanylate cyclase (GGDEF)-like protein/PAS domain S-box-containing protein